MGPAYSISYVVVNWKSSGTGLMVESKKMQLWTWEPETEYIVIAQRVVCGGTVGSQQISTPTPTN